VKTKHDGRPRALFAEENRGLLLDLVVFFLNLFLMQWLTGYAVALFGFANDGKQQAQFMLSLACVGMFV
jgi:hypothetical protein